MSLPVGVLDRDRNGGRGQVQAGRAEGGGEPDLAGSSLLAFERDAGPGPAGSTFRNNAAAGSGDWSARSAATVPPARARAGARVSTGSMPVLPFGPAETAE